MQIFVPLHPIRAKRLAWYIKKLNPVAYYPLKEVNGTTAVNYAPANLRTLNGTITGATIGQDGLLGKAYSFDGSDDLVTVSANATFNTDNFSLVMLLRPDTLRIQGIFDKNDFTNAWRLFMNDTNGTLEFDARSDADNCSDTDAVIAQDTWSIVVVTYDKSATTGVIYINGVEKATQSSFTNAGNDNNNTPRIAPLHTAQFDGFIQHVAFFNRVLTSNEITKLARIVGLA